MTQSQFVLFDEMVGQDGNLGVMTLNRPQVLNALNHAMFLSLDQQLTTWAEDPNIKAVVIRAAEGRAFCAGGDIRHAHQLKMNNDPELVNFFRDEYEMNKRIYHFPKPYIALLDGITMGGGVGVSLHGSHRIGTEKLSFAMPETSIGFYPDVGTTHFLSRLPNQIGIYLGLTGVRINYADCLAIGIVQQVVAHDTLEKVLNSLAQSPLPDNQTVTKIIQPFCMSVEESTLLKHRDEINSCFSKNSVEEILQALENYPTEWCQQTAELLKANFQHSGIRSLEFT